MTRRYVVAALAFAAAACSSGSNVQVRTQSAPAFATTGRSTFRILPVPARTDGGTLPSNDPMLANSITNRQLRQDVRQALEARGYRPADGERADFDVAVYAAANQALDIRSYDYGYTWRGWPREYTTVTPYEKGTVILDLVDPGTRQLLWRGQGVAQVSDNPNKYANEMGKVVDKIAKKLPEAHS
ncbi:MAG TPA: DUF4136 domain-containing protein [Gemmatimonadaceae bacterium]|jgi:hypothetical protein|nr:DUF4136 domain-containing protein [Gemmatimonadaceae bacterium]